MTLETKSTHVGPFQHVFVRASVRGVTSNASFRLDRAVFMLPGTRALGVALHAGRILLADCLGLSARACAVRIVTVRALDDALVHLVVERHRKIVAFIPVALITKSWLRILQQRIRLAVVHVVTPQAIHIAAPMRRFVETLMPILVAVQAKRLAVPGLRVHRVPDLRFVSSCLDVIFPISMARFACTSCATVGPRMRIPRKILHEVRMAGCAHRGAVRAFV